MAKKAALGKGLEALLGNELGDLKQGVRYVSDTPYGMEQVQTAEKEAGNVETPGQMISEIPVSQIEPNPFQPRKEFDEEALSELASSIKTLGLIQPITVRRINPTKFQIISGERRYRACRMAGVEKSRHTSAKPTM